MIFRKIAIERAEMSRTEGYEIQGIVVGMTAKITYRASIEPSEDIWIVFMAIVKDFHVK